MPSIREVRASNAAHDFSYIPVALFAGGTSGIGQGMAEEFAKITKGNAHIIILGRNRAAAEAIISSFPTPTSPDAIHEFVECDVSLMKTVDKVTKDLLSRLPRLNFLVLSTGGFDFKKKDDTEEGMSKKMAVFYYGRWKLIYDLIPLLQKAKDAEQAASVMTVLSTYRSGKIDVDDLGLKKGAGLTALVYAGATYTDLSVESFAKRNPGMSFIHIHPGTVRTPLLTNFFKHWALQPVNWFIRVLSYPFSISMEYCAQYMLWTLFLPETGASRRDETGGNMGPNPYHNDDETAEKLWEHTLEEVKKALSSSSPSTTS